jgi:plastocyanin
MRRRIRIAAATVMLGIAALSVGGGAQAGASGAPSRLLVKGVEFNLTLSRDQIDHGPSIVDFQNDGQDPHNLVIQKVGGGPKHQTGGKTPAGAVDEINLRFRPGKRYVLFCSLKHHRRKGMVAHISVSG